MTPQLPYLNLGCGRVILPAPKPAHHGLIPDGVHDYALWHNVDVIPSAGVDEVSDVFRYPFAWADNSFDGALLTHLVEHVPHEIKSSKFRRRRETLIFKDMEEAEKAEREPDEHDNRSVELARLPDGFYAFFAELHRVLTPGALAHILVPYAFSTGAVQDPTHTRYLTPESFTYLVPNPDAPFVLPGLGAWAIEDTRYGLTENVIPYQHDDAMVQRAIRTQINIVSEVYVRLRVVK